MNKKGEISTLILIGTLLVLGTSIFASSQLNKDRKTLQSQAGGHTVGRGCSNPNVKSLGDPCCAYEVDGVISSISDPALGGCDGGGPLACVDNLGNDDYVCSITVGAGCNNPNIKTCGEPCCAYVTDGLVSSISSYAQGGCDGSGPLACVDSNNDGKYFCSLQTPGGGYDELYCPGSTPFPTSTPLPTLTPVLTATPNPTTTSQPPTLTSTPTPTTPPTATPTRIPQCNSTCQTDTNCPAGLICYSTGNCRLPANPQDINCYPPAPTRTPTPLPTHIPPTVPPGSTATPVSSPTQKPPTQTPTPRPTLPADQQTKTPYTISLSFENTSVENGITVCATDGIAYSEVEMTKQILREEVVVASGPIGTYSELFELSGLRDAMYTLSINVTLKSDASKLEGISVEKIIANSENPYSFSIKIDCEDLSTQIPSDDPSGVPTRPSGISDETWNTYLTMYNLYSHDTTKMLPNGMFSDETLVYFIIRLELSTISGDIRTHTLEAIKNQYIGYGCRSACSSLKQQLNWLNAMQGWYIKNGSEVSFDCDYCWQEAIEIVNGTFQGIADNQAAWWWGNSAEGSVVSNYLDQYPLCDAPPPWNQSLLRGCITQVETNDPNSRFDHFLVVTSDQDPPSDAMGF